MDNNLIQGINELSVKVYSRNVVKGFYERQKNIGEMLCLIHSEVSEALEADRKDRYSTFAESAPNGEEMDVIKIVNGFSEDDDFKQEYDATIKGTFEEEMADIFIRVLDMCAYKSIDIGQHVKAKMRYNLTREKYHGKKY